MASESKTTNIFVTGATGNQGSGVVKALCSLNQHVTIRALSRDPSAPKAKSLLDLPSSRTSTTVESIQGSLDEPDTFAVALRDCSIVFINLVRSPTDPSLEMKQMSTILDIFLASPATNKYVIYSCAINSHDPIDHTPFVSDMARTFFNGKKEMHQLVGQRCAAAGVPYTILQPGYFFSNWLPPMSNFIYPELASRQLMRHATRPSFVLPGLDAGELPGLVVGKLVSAWQENPTLPEWNGKNIPLASDKQTMSEMADVMTRVLKRKGKDVAVQAEFVSEAAAVAEVAEGKSFRLAVDLYQNEFKIEADTSSLDTLGVKMKSFEEYLEEHFAGLVEAVGLS